MELDEAVEKIKKLEDQVSEFRGRNIEQARTLDEFEGINPDEVRALLQQKKDLETQELIKSGDVEEALEKQRAALTADFDKRFQALQGANEGLESQLVTLQVTDRLRSSATASGVRPEAVDDVIARASADWQLQDGAPVCIINDQVQLSKDKAGENLGIDEYFKQLGTDKPFYFSASGGGGGEEGRGVRNGSPRIIEPEEMGQHIAQIKDGSVVVRGYEPDAA